MSSFFLLTAVASIVCGLVINTVDAATYVGPSDNPPNGNVPSAIWNRYGSASGQQTGTTFNIDADGFDPLTSTGTKGVGIGSAALVIGPTQNLIYGNVDTTSTGKLLLLQTESVDKFSVDVKGNVKAAGCFGATFVGVTSSLYHGSTLGAVGSYVAADNKCHIMGGAFSGSHVCRPDEILESFSCSVGTDPIRVIANGVSAWINGGAPGYLADANDCVGWQSVSASAYGKYWDFHQTTGGVGKMTGCNIGTGLAFACCK